MCNPLFYFLYLYKISINFYANEDAFKLLEWFGLTLNIADSEISSVNTTNLKIS